MLFKLVYLIEALNEIVKGRLREDKKTYALFSDIQKTYDSMWHDGLWYKLWDIEQGVAQGCSLSPILFSVFINDLLKEVEQTGLGIQLSSGKTVRGMLFADDFVGISDSKESLQRLLDVGYIVTVVNGDYEQM